MNEDEHVVDLRHDMSPQLQELAYLPQLENEGSLQELDANTELVRVFTLHNARSHADAMQECPDGGENTGGGGCSAGAGEHDDGGGSTKRRRVGRGDGAAVVLGREREEEVEPGRRTRGEDGGNERDVLARVRPDVVDLCANKGLVALPEVLSLSLSLFLCVFPSLITHYSDLIARYEERGPYPKPGCWANCDELGSLAA